MQIAVLGSWEKELDGRVRDLAEEVGRLVARRGDVVMTGGSTGVMEASMKGAKSAGGLTVGFVPGDRKEAYQYLGNHIDLFIMTGTSELGKLAPLIHSADGIVAIAGGAGTFIEICMAYLEDKLFSRKTPGRRWSCFTLSFREASSGKPLPSGQSPSHQPW